MRSAGQQAIRNVRNHVAELVAFAPDVILFVGIQTAGPLLDATRMIPIVFALVSDPVGDLCKCEDRRQYHGFCQFEFSIGGKWLELLKESPLVAAGGCVRTPQWTPVQDGWALSSLLRHLSQWS